MLLVSARGLSRTVGVRPLFEDLSVEVADGDRLGVIGPNGSGKSTLLKILHGIERPDTGEVAPASGLRAAFVTQVDDFSATDTPVAVVTAALLARGQEPHEAELTAAVHLRALGFSAPRAELGPVVAAGTAPVDAPVTSLSGGWRKRLQIAAALAADPQLLYLDEPTNHLDLEGVLWLERLLSEAPFACCLVSHDRAFLDSVCTAVLEISPVHAGGSFRSNGGYSDFLEARDLAVAAQRKSEERLANTVTREVAWLRRNPKAQMKRAASRVANAEQRQADLQEVAYRNRQANVTTSIGFNATQRRTVDLVVGRDMGIAVGGRTLAKLPEFDLGPGDRVGILGRNGTGKSTILRTLAGELPLAGGSLKKAQDLRVVYFRQDRSSLDPRSTLRRALAPNGDVVAMPGGGSQHVMAWARRLRFRVEQLEEPVGSLSGGEQARLLIAQLATRPADLLLLDEPTNDLDLPTLEVLEESLLAFPGAVLLVSHDRALVDRVSTRLLALDGNGGAGWHADYWQWQKAEEARLEAEVAARADAETRVRKATAPKAVGAGMSKSERREWERMEEKIATAEAVVAALQARMAEPANATDA
jgi:ATP-binding cassette subfamily F protein uup